MQLGDSGMGGIQRLLAKRIKAGTRNNDQARQMHLKTGAFMVIGRKRNLCQKVIQQVCQT